MRYHKYPVFEVFDPASLSRFGCGNGASSTRAGGLSQYMKDGQHYLS